jgi:Arc/MetJ-type ribon-helix-helix transcriptional regulator
MVQPRKGGRQVAVRLPDELLKRVDARVEALKAQGGLFSGVTRSDVIREAVEALFNALDATKTGSNSTKGAKR